MKRFSLFVTIFCLLLLHVKAQVNTQDSLSLVSIRSTAFGDRWTQKWDLHTPVSTWYGVTITNGRVTELNLSHNNLRFYLSGTMMGRLTKLRVLDLSNNALSEDFPSGLANLTELEHVNLSTNLLSGTIAATFFNKLTKLKTFNISQNQLSGWIPSSIGNATALQEADFSNNAFTNKIPAGVNSLTHLTRFLAANNKLIGPMPTGKLCSPAVQVDISGNQFTFAGVECLGANPNAVYNNQQQLIVAQNNLTLSVAAGGTLANNTYTWYRNGGSSPYFVSTGTTNKLNTTLNGKYWAVVTNSAAPALALRTDTILLNGSATSDSLALVDLYNNTNGPAWTNKTNWLTSAPLSEWFGVGLNEGRVESLHLNDNNLDGQLPASFENLPLAYELVLRGNKLKGTIPRTFASHDVFHIDLSYNQFTSIPADYNIIGTFLDLSNNQLSGLVPVPVITVPILRLHGNRFNFSDLVNVNRQDGGIILDPQQPKPLIVNAPELTISVGGNLANNRYRWYRDEVLVAAKDGDSTFTMTLPGNYRVAVYNTSIANLLLTSETFFYTAPEFEQDSLALVDFYNGIASGLNWVLTNPVSTWEGVTIVEGRVKGLTVGGLSGTISPSIGNITEMRGIYIDEGNLTGTIPSTIANWKNLQDINIFKNNLTGPIPDDLGRYQPNLGFIFIDDNPLTGQIPSGLQNATNLIELYIRNTQISGPIPVFFKNLPLFDIDLSGNKLTGSIPDTLSSQEGYGSIRLNNNQLTGTLPKPLQGKALLIDFSNNKLSGSLPDSIGYYAIWIRLSDNKFTGKVPTLRGQYIDLNLGNNLLESVDPVNCGITLDVSDGYPIELRNNKLNFTGLECLASIEFVEQGQINYNPQQRIPIINTNPILKAAAGGTLANNTYKWYKNTGYFTTKTGDSTLTITTPGVYHCIVTNSAVPGVELRTHNANISTVSSRKIQPGETGNDDATLNATGKLSVYPNPTGGDFLYIKGLQRAESILLYNAAGQLVQQWQNVNGNQQLNISGVTNGVYMIKVVEKDKQTLLKFMKQ